MAITYVDYTATAGQTDFDFTFPYLEDEHVTVWIDGTQQLFSDYQVIVESNNTTKIRLNVGASLNEIVRVRRKSQPDQNLVDFINGSVLTESELDRAYLHNRYLNEEIGELNDASLQIWVDAAGNQYWNAKGLQIKNVADPTDPQDAATKNYTDTKDALKVNKSGDTMTGNLVMSGATVTGVPAPISGSDAVNKTYLDGWASAIVTGTGLPPSFNKFTGTGSQTTFSLTFTTNGIASTAILVAIDGEVIDPDDYAILGGADEVEFTTPPPLNSEILVIERGFKVKTEIPTEYDWGGIVGDPVTANYSYGKL